jgi:hypothetical protein
VQVTVKRTLAEVRMFGMTASSAERGSDDWVSTRATIIACKQTQAGAVGLSLDGYYPPEYVITFSYLADGQPFKGTYRANSSQECGHDFEILYDPKHPSRNTGSDVLTRRWGRMSAAALGIVAVLIGIWFWGKEVWFQW